MPVALLTGGMAITQRGDVFLESDKATYVVVIPSGKIPSVLTAMAGTLP